MKVCYIVMVDSSPKRFWKKENCEGIFCAKDLSQICQKISRKTSRPKAIP